MRTPETDTEFTIRNLERAERKLDAQLHALSGRPENTVGAIATLSRARGVIRADLQLLRDREAGRELAAKIEALADDVRSWADPKAVAELEGLASRLNDPADTAVVDDQIMPTVPIEEILPLKVGDVVRPHATASYALKAAVRGRTGEVTNAHVSASGKQLLHVQWKGDMYSTCDYLREELQLVEGEKR